MFRCGIIGCGWVGYGVSKDGHRWGNSHAHAYALCLRTKLVSLCDTNGKFDYIDYMEMVKHENLDIVSVCVPPETHAGMVCSIAPFVKGIYCEKPIATTLEDADRMIEVCHKHGVILQINHQRRWYKPKFRFSRGILDSGTHAFDLVNQLFKPEVEVEFEYVDTTGLPWEKAHVFELDCTNNDKPNVPIAAVEHLVDCIKNRHESISSGEEARKALAQCLRMMEEYGETGISRRA